MRRLNERSALIRTIKQLNINNFQAIRYAYGLIIETTRRKNLIDKFVNSVIFPKKISDYPLGIQSFLRLYIYETRVVKNWKKININEAENIANLGRSILGWQIMREIEQYLGFLLTHSLQSIMESANEIEQISLETYNPLWFVEYCFKLFGRSEGEKFLRANLNPPPNYIRVNTLVATEEETISKLEAEGFKVEKTDKLSHTYEVSESKKPLNTLTILKEGSIYLQDKASCFATIAANPSPGAVVFDVCAAPGAKTTFLAQLMNNEGEIYSIDFSLKRMRTWQKETCRMGVKICSPIIADARVSIPLVGKADVLVLDPPCTSTGVFAKQPSAKWRLTSKSIQNMAKIQLMMLNNCAEKVANGGTLTYSTCSITEEENEGVIETFMKEHPEFVLVDVEPKIGVPGLRGLIKCQRLYPHIHKCNGFFVAKMQKSGSV